ncbi:uncharacterized protein LOC144139270 [Haemaphysalis longicornis]
MSRAGERLGPYHQATRGGSSGYGRRSAAANPSWNNGGRLNYWPIVLPPPTLAAPPPRQPHPSAAVAAGPAYMNGGAAYRHPGSVPDLGPLNAHSTGPGPAIVVAAEEPDPDDDSPRRCPAVAVACQRYRRNTRLMTRLLDQQVVDVSPQDFEALLSRRQKQRSELEEKLREVQKEAEALVEQQRQKMERWLDEDRAFTENLRKCRDRQFLMQLARKAKSPPTRATAPSNKTAFRLRYVP